MTETWFLATLWLGLALAATLLSIWLRIATALSEIVVGTVAQSVIGAVISSTVLGVNEPWIKFLAGTGAIVPTFLAGAELDPEAFKRKWEEATALGIAGFIAPFLDCTAVTYYILGWDGQASWLAGVALSTTSVAVVYAVMPETGLNTTTFGKTVLAGCFINDLGTVLGLGLIFGGIGLSHRIIDTAQYSFLIAAVVGSAVIPTLITNAFFYRGTCLKAPIRRDGASRRKPAAEMAARLGSQTGPELRLLHGDRGALLSTKTAILRILHGPGC